MTMIAGFTVGEVPVLIGDLLTSSFVEEESIPLPSHEDSRAIYPEGSGVALGLVQKIAIVNRYLALAWSGPRIAASVAIKELRQLTSDGPIDWDDFRCHLEKLRNDPDFSELSFIGLGIDKKGNRIIFVHNAWSMGGTSAGKNGYYAGTGGQDFADAVRSPSPIISDGSPEFTAITAAHAIQSTFLAREINAVGSDPLVVNPLHQFYGGAYETAMFSDNGVGKVGDTTILYCEVKVREGRVKVSPPVKFIKRHYVGDALILRWSRIEIRGDLGRMGWKDQRCVRVPSVDEHSRVTSLEVKDWPNFNSKYEGHALFVVDDCGHRNAGGRLYMPLGDRYRSLIFEEAPEQQSTVVRLNPAAIPWMENYLQKHADQGILMPQSAGQNL